MSTVPKTNLTVYLVLFFHKHGIGCWVSSSEEKAKDSVFVIMLQGIDTVFPEEKSRIRRALMESIDNKQFRKAQTLWLENTSESFEIHERKVDEAWLTITRASPSR